jgi:segregation and condensation protein B
MEKIYNSVIEALIFASDEPITRKEIIEAIKEIDGDDVEIKEKDVDAAVEELNESYESQGRSFSILRIANGFAFGTKAEYSKYVGYLSTEKSKRRLSHAALETLAIVAYKQPITKPEIETIRGVNSDYIINTLLEKGLITIKGRADSVGRPLLYVTTNNFLKYFGLNKITDLPKPREIEELMKDAEYREMERQMLKNAVEEEILEAEEKVGDEGTT